MILVERRRPERVREHPRAGWFAVATVCFGAFMGQLDASIVTLTFPTLQREFHAPMAAVQWVSLAYLLVLVGLLAVAGRFADAFGRKLVYLQGFAVFGIGSVLCGLAGSLEWLILFRVIQAVGAAMLQANSVALVVTSVSRERMRAALGVQAAAQALGLALGPALGGVLVQSAGWRWVFWIAVPVSCLALVAGRYLLPRTRERTPLRRFDTPGFLALAVASTAMLLTLSGMSGLPMPEWAVIALAIGSGLAAVMFVARERRTASPLIDLTALKPAAVSCGLAGALCGYLVLFGPLALFPQVFAGRGVDELASGLVLSALPAGFAATALTIDRLAPAQWGPRTRSLLGALTCVFAAGTAAVVPSSVAVDAVALFGLGLGLGLGVLIPANNTAIMRAIPARMSAVGGGLVNMSRGLGTAIGVALVTLCLHVGAGTAGPRLAMAGLALVALLAGALSLPLHDHRYGVGHSSTSAGDHHARPSHPA
jgi:EmrB/QacA subfamily drug resistance transporter